MATAVKLNSFENNHATLEVTVEITRQFRFRIWLGKQLLRLAARVLGCGFKWIEV